MSSSDWFEHVLMYQLDEQTVHLYLGTPLKPRSSLVIIENGIINEPIRVPISSPQTLNEQYKKYSNSNDSLSSNSKFILALLGKIDIHFQYSKESKLESLIFPESIEETSTSLTVLNIDEYLEDSQWQSKDLIPLNQRLVDVLNSSDRMSLIEIDLFLKILTRPSRHSRQKALTSLILIQSEERDIILNLLFKTREEVQISILRELARQGNQYTIAYYFAKDILSSEKTALKYYSYLYMLRFHFNEIENTSWMTQREFEGEKWKFKPSQQKIKEIMFYFKNKQGEKSRGLEIMNFLHSDFEELRIITNGIINSDFVSIEAKDLRSALMYNLKYVEFIGDPILLANIAALSLIGAYTVFDKKLIIKGGNFNFEMRYVFRRIIKLLEIWKVCNQQNKIKLTLTKLLILHPPDRFNYYGDLEENTKKWLTQHPIFSKFPKILNKIGTSDDLISISKSILEKRHILLQFWVEHNLKKTENIDLTDFEKIVPILAGFPDSFQIPETLFLDNNITEINGTDIRPSFQLLQFAVNWKLALSESLFKNSLDRFIDLDELDNPIFGQFLYMIGLHHKSHLFGYFDRIRDLVTSELITGPTPTEKYLLLNIITKWHETTGVFPNDTQLEFIDSIKIIFQKEIDNFDLEPSRLLSIQTIVNVYSLTKGAIPSFIEMSIQFSFSKPVWEQLARHYLALGLQRPNRDSISKSKLKEIPQYLLKDVLGQIALINQTISYCEQNGFRTSFENLMVNNLYRRGWNVERRLERKLPTLFGVISPRLRSFLATYLVIESGEVRKDILKLARDVEEYQLRVRLLRDLDRYATADMWIIMAEAYHNDISTQALRKIKESRMSAKQRSQITVQMMSSSKGSVRNLGVLWLQETGIQQDDLTILLTNPYIDMWSTILDYVIKSKFKLTEIQQNTLANFILDIIWHPSLKKNIRNQAISNILFISSANIQVMLKSSLMKLIDSNYYGRKGDAIKAISRIGVKH